MAAIQSKFRPRHPLASIGLTSLMDVMTILLVFMLVNYRSKPGPELPKEVSLPLVSSLPVGAAESDLKDALNIVLTPGMLKVGDTAVSLIGSVESVALAFADAVAKERNRDNRVRNQFIVQAGARTPYSEIDRIVRAASRLGVTRLRFVAQVAGGTQ